MSAKHFLRRKSDWWLLAYQASVYALFAALFLAFARAPLWFQIASYPIAALLTQKYESPLHYAVHTPLFRQKFLNALHRLSWFLFPMPAVLYRREHFHHHRYNNMGRDQTSTLDASGTRHVSVFAYVGRNLATTRNFYRKLNRSERREATVHLALCLALQVALCAYDPFTALVFWLPISWLGVPIMNALFCYFGHVPGNPHSKYLAATYVPIESRWQRVLSWLDFHNSAYHLTHHIHPSVHWSDLGQTQKSLESEYQRRGSPRSMAFNSMILLNPLALFTTTWRVNRARGSVLIEPPRPTPDHRDEVAAQPLRPSESYRRPVRGSSAPRAFDQARDRTDSQPARRAVGLVGESS